LLEMPGPGKANRCFQHGIVSRGARAPLQESQWPIPHIRY